jgi:adenine deaminase
MNYPGVIAGDEKMHAELRATTLAGKVIGGHYPSPDLGQPFHAYVAGGIEDDHEGTRPEDAIARARQGMKVMLRHGSAWHDVVSQVAAITSKGLDPRHFLLCTDDSHAETIYSGHMDRVVRVAIEAGVPPMTAIQMATLNTAEHFGVSRKMGSIAPGRSADILLVDDLKDFHAKTVIVRGVVAAENGKVLVTIPSFPYPAWVMNSVKIPRKLSAGDFSLKAPPSSEKVNVNVIGIIENQAPTRHLHMEIAVKDGELQTDIRRDLAKIALIERHHGTGIVQVAFVSGYGFTAPCAVASTVAHDSHHMLIVGTDENCMAIAANRLAETGGGQVVVRDGKIIGEVQLPIAGLMSNERAEVVARKAASVLEGFKACGCELNNPNMQLSLLGLVVIPELRISDKGLVDVTRFEIIPVVEQ